MATIYDEGREVDADGQTGMVQVVRTLRISPYTAWLPVALSLLGGVKLVGGKLVRVPGRPDPELPFCYCERIKLAGIPPYTGPSANGTQNLDQVAVYQDARITATYNTFLPEDIDQVTENFDFQARQLTLPIGTYGRMGANKAPDPVEAALPTDQFGATKTQTSIEYTLTRHGVQTIPLDAIGQLQGLVNKKTFTISVATGVRQGGTIGEIKYSNVKRSFPPESLRFEGATATRKITLYGIHFYDLTYKFVINNIKDVCADGGTGNDKVYVGWNRLYIPTSNKYERIAVIGNTKRGIYQYAEDVKQDAGSGFDLLFSPDAI